MSSPASISANKSNAVRSTGPLTASGKQRASRNALKHGLSTSIRDHPDILSKIEALAVAIGGVNSVPHRLQAARGIAEAEWELRRQREFRLALVEVEAAKIRAFTVPLRRGHHRETHRCGDEAKWWRKLGIDPTAVARALWLETHPLPTVQFEPTSPKYGIETEP
jgi:hypothetical protein